MKDDVLSLAYEVTRVTEEKIGVIDAVMRRTRILSLNARLEASRAGERGAAFSIVAQEMAALAAEVNNLSAELRGAIASNIAQIETAGEDMLFSLRGARFADLARNVVEIMDRNLYERSCDVRWWATDSAVVGVAADPSADGMTHAADRLATILRSYTVYLDLWVADIHGNIVATGRGDRYSNVLGRNVSSSEWFIKAMGTVDGDDFAVCDICRNDLLGGALVATYATAIREGGTTGGQPIGALGIFFDWEPQASAIVKGVALTADERRASRVMMLNARHEVIASSDGEGLLSQRFDLRPTTENHGYYRDGGSLVSYSLTPGYETYRGLGWYGCIETRLASSKPEQIQMV